MADKQKLISDLKRWIDWMGEDAPVIACNVLNYLETEPNDHPEIVLCKDCRHRGVMPEGGSSGFDIVWPKDEDGWKDSTCPFCCSDPFYSGIPEDSFYCKHGLRKEENK